MERKVTEIRGDVVRSTTVRNPRLWLIHESHVSSWIPCCIFDTEALEARPVVSSAGTVEADCSAWQSVPACRRSGIVQDCQFWLGRF
ncbi:unnamed protein product [Brassica oleracea var. botrytis]